MEILNGSLGPTLYRGYIIGAVAIVVHHGYYCKLGRSSIYRSSIYRTPNTVILFI